jgi:drug/metabolite transporter (DMT)-like permease
MSRIPLDRRFRTAGLFFTLAGLWGGTYPATKVGLEAFPPILLAAFRLDLAAVLLLVYATSSFDYWRPRCRRDWLAVLSGGVLTLAGYSVMLNIGQQSVPSAIAAILAGLIPLLTIGFARVFLPEEHFGMRELLGVSLGFVGLVLITQPDMANLQAADTVGQIILVVAAASFALGGVLTQWAEAAMPFAPRTAWAMLVGALFTHGVNFLRASEPLRIAQVSPRGILAVVFLGVFVSAIGYLVYFHLLSRLGSVELNLVTYGAAMSGTIFSWILFGEQVTGTAVAGFLLILLGFVVLKRDEIAMEYRKLIRHLRTESKR